MGGALVNSLSYTDDMVLLAPTVTALQQLPSERQHQQLLSERYVTHMLDLMTLYTTQQKQYVCWSDERNPRVGTQQDSGSEMRNLALLRSFVTFS